MARVLLDHGWTDVRPLLGGFEAWQQAGYPTEPKEAPSLTLREAAENARKAEGDEGAVE